MTFGDSLYPNKDLEIGQKCVLNSLFKEHYPQGYDQLHKNIYIIKDFEGSEKMFAVVSWNGNEFSWHSAYLKKYK